MEIPDRIGDFIGESFFSFYFFLFSLTERPVSIPSWRHVWRPVSA
jgi:hypothetical protein